jgi:hypothetical protein
MTTIKKIARLRTISILHGKQHARIANAEQRIKAFHKESEKLLRSIPKKDCVLYAEKIAKYVCV